MMCEFLFSDMFPMLNDPVTVAAGSTWQTLTSDLYPDGMLGNLNMEYKIISSGGDVISIEVSLQNILHCLLKSIIA